jgi:fructokinase
MTEAPDPRAVTLGEALVDLIGEDAGAEEGGTVYHARPGGSPMNVAVASARQGLSTAFLTRLSTDAFGTLLRNHLTNAGVDLRWAERGAEPTSLAVVTLDRERNASYGFYRAATADVAYDPLPRPTLPASVRVGTVTVSLLRDPARTAFRDVVQEHGRRGRGQITWLVDPNVRPALVDDWEAFERDVDAWADLADVVRVSTEDLDALDLDEARAAARWLDRGAIAVVVTAGPDGARLHRSGRPVLQVPGRSVDVVDTVGAGDTFTAGLLSGLVDGPGLDDLDDEAWRTVLRRAVAASSITCTRQGADPPTADEVAAVLSTNPGGPSRR